MERISRRSVLGLVLTVPFIKPEFKNTSQQNLYLKSDLYISRESLEDIRNWNMYEIDKNKVIMNELFRNY